MKEMEPWVFDKGSLVFQENSFHSCFLVISVHKDCDARIFSLNTNVERCSADKKLLTDTKIDVEKVVPRKTSNLLIRKFHTNKHFLTISVNQISIRRSKTPYWLTYQHLKSSKMSIRIFIEEKNR